MFCAPVSTPRLRALAPSLPLVTSLPVVFRRALLLAGCVASLVLPSLSRAQVPGALDTTFSASINDANLFALSLQQNNGETDVFVGGDEGTAGLLGTNGLQLPTTTFSLGIFGDLARIIYVAVPELIPNGSSPPKILIGGLFGRGAAESELNERARNIIRINPDGSLDLTFNPLAGANGYVTAILPLSSAYDGGIVVGGMFTAFNKVGHDHIVRLDNAGNVVDNSVFSSKLDFDDTVLSLAAQGNPDPTGPQGQILVAGLFANVNGNPHARLARVNADGTVDESFRPVFDNRVRVVISQDDGKILAGGDFQTVNGTAINHLVRLNYDGSIDTTFRVRVSTQPPLIDAPVAVNAITPALDGGYYIGGNFYKINGVIRNFLGRVDANGNVDEFDSGNAITNAVQRIAVDSTTNLIYVTETRSKSIGTKLPPELVRLFGGAPPTPRVDLTPFIPASSGNEHSQFRFTRSAVLLAQPLTVYVTFTGTGVLKAPGTGPGTFRFLPLPIGAADIDGKKTYVLTFPANVNTISVDVKSTKRLSGSETVGLTLQTNPNNPGAYEIGNSPSATVSLTR